MNQSLNNLDPEIKAIVEYSMKHELALKLL